MYELEDIKLVIRMEKQPQQYINDTNDSLADHAHL